MADYTLTLSNLGAKEAQLLLMVTEALQGQLHLSQETALNLHTLLNRLQSAFGPDAEGFVLACETEVEQFELVAVQLECLADLIQTAIGYPPEHRCQLRQRVPHVMELLERLGDEQSGAMQVYRRR